MLILTPNIKGEASCRAVARETVVSVEALCIGTAEVIDNSLAEMIAVVQWRPTDRYISGVDRFNFRRIVRSAVEESQFECEFLFELKFKGGDCFWRASVCLQFTFGLVQQVRGFKASPRPRREKHSADIAHACQLLHRRIDPAIERQGWRSHVFGIVNLLSSVLVFLIIAPSRAAEFGVVMSAIDVARKIPSEGATHYGIGREVLFAGNARQRHRRGQAVSGDL